MWYIQTLKFMWENKGVDSEHIHTWSEEKASLVDCKTEKQKWQCQGSCTYQFRSD